MSEHCYICKRKYDFVYSVPDEVWEKISPAPVDGFKSGGLLCIECANTRADEHGIVLFWSAGVNGYPDADLRERHVAFVRAVYKVVSVPTWLPDCDLLDKVSDLCDAELDKEKS